MATRNARKPAAPPAAAPASTAPGWEWLADVNRQQMVAATESASAFFRGFESVRRIQEQAAHAAAERHAVAAEAMRKRTSPADLALLQGEVLRDDLVCAARYWQELADAALEMNTEIVNAAVQSMNTEAVFAAAPRFLHS